MGSENSLSASDMYSKHNTNITGDLSSTTSHKGGNLLATKSKEEFGGLETFSFTTPVKSSDNEIEEFDVADSQAEVKKAAGIVRPVLKKKIGRYSHIKTATVFTLADLDGQTRNMEFRNLFRLSSKDTIVMEELNCHFYQKYSGSFCLGHLYLSENFLNYATVSADVNQSGNTASMMLLDCSGDPSLLFVIPYSHIVSVQKQPPTALAFSNAKLAISLSGYLVISTKNKVEFWLSFSSAKSRDRVSTDLLQRIKTVGWKFDDDFIIGKRNSPPEFEQRSSSPSKSSSRSRLSMKSSFEDLNGGTEEILTMGLKFVNPIIGKDGSEEIERTTQSNLNLWTEYFETRGKDVCIVKDIKAIKNLLATTNGVPDLYRGDFWMLASGAWYTRPSRGYYQSLLRDNKNKINPFEEEIEKDVRR
jgi:hypothetical protein